MFKNYKKELQCKEKELQTLKETNEALLGQLKEIGEENAKIFESKQSDCVKGEWCKGCNFYTEYQTLNFGVYMQTLHYCSKGKCSNFVKKSEIN